MLLEWSDQEVDTCNWWNFKQISLLKPEHEGGHFWKSLSTFSKNSERCLATTDSVDISDSQGGLLFFKIKR